MKKISVTGFILGLILCSLPLNAQEGLVPAFKLEPNVLTLHRPALPGTPLVKVGRRFAVLGDESGSFEAWAFPLKIIRDFEFSFFVRSSTRPLRGRDIVRYISVFPEATILTFTYQSFTAKAVFITPVQESGAVILLDVHSTEPLDIVCGFYPVLQPMWPAGLGGQYAYWDDKLKACFITEPTGKNHGVVGCPSAKGISYTPAHMLSEAPNEFKIEITDPCRIEGKYIPIILAGGKGSRESVVRVYEKLRDSPEVYYRKNLEHYRRLRESTLQVQTPNRKLNLAFEWAKVALDNLVVENPDLGKGLVAGWGKSGTSGRPGFGWFFGGDAYINTFSLLSFGAFDTARDALAFTQKWQRKDGKMAHELSQAAAYIDWWKDYHYGYIHGDTTPYYIAAMDDYLRMSGDADFIRESWESLKRAYEWCLSTDENGDGLMDNRKAGLGALEYGDLTGIETDIYLASVWGRAACAMQHLAGITGKKSYAARASQHYLKAKKAFDEEFWDEGSQFYVYAFNEEGGQVKEISPWNAVGLMWNFGTPERSMRSLERLSSSELSTDWGVRSLSSTSEYFQPLDYTYGAVWPFLTGWVTSAFYAHHLPLQGFSLLMATARHTFDHGLGCIAEVFSGAQNVWLQEAVAHQGFSTAGMVLPFVRGLMGLEGDAQRGSLTFSPHFPAQWKHVSINNYKVGKAAFSFDYTRHRDKMTVDIRAENAKRYTIHFAPAVGIGSRIHSLTVNGKSHSFEAFEAAQVVQVSSHIPLEESRAVVEVIFTPALEILPVLPPARVGDINRGLKIISVESQGSRMIVHVEGRASEAYELGVMNFGLVDRVNGARLEGEKLTFQIPEERSGKFVSYRIIIHLKE